MMTAALQIGGLVALLAHSIALPLSGQGLPWDEVAGALVERMQLERGERVLLVAQPGMFDALVPRLRAAITSAGAYDLGAIAGDGETPTSWSTPFTRGARGMSRQQLVQYFHDVDLAVMLPGASTTHAPYAAMQDLLRTNRARTIHFHWAGAYDMHGKLLPNDTNVDRVYVRALLQTDYAELSARQAEFERAMRGNVVRVTTPEGTDIRFEIGDRPVTQQDGDASAHRAVQAENLIDREIELPAGAVRVAPVEESVHGTIAFPDALWHGNPVEGLVMHFEAGRVTGFEATSGQDHVAAELREAGESGRAFREFALGFNPALAIRTDDGRQWIPYYGYGAGVVRLSLGDNTELGGTVTGGYVRWNFFPNATVRVGEDVWVRAGQMIR